MFTGIFGALLGLAIQTRRRWLSVLDDDEERYENGRGKFDHA
jgi:hypothetical protein